MALSPQEIYELDKEIFNFLYNKHLEAKEKGEEFYFDINPYKGENIDNGNESIKIEQADKYYYFTDAFSQEFIVVSFYKYYFRPLSHIILFISKNEDKTYQLKCQINVAVDTISYNELGQKEAFIESNKEIEKLGSFLQQQRTNWQKLPLNGYKSWTNTYYAYLLKYDNLPSLEDSFWEFLYIDKPLIDNYLKNNTDNKRLVNEKSLLPSIITKSYFESNIKKANFIFSQPKDVVSENCLPLAFSRFFISKYDVIEELEIAPITPTTKWIFLTGENAAGKTSILSAIYYFLTPSNSLRLERPSTSERDSTFAAAIEISKNGIYTQTIYHKFPESHHTFMGTHDKIMALGLVHGKEEENNPYFNNAIKFLYDRYKSTYRKQHYHSLVEVLREFLPNLSRVEIDENIEAEEYEKGVVFYEKDEFGNELGQATFSQLAMGYKNIINLITNIILELSNIKGKITEFIMPKDLYGIAIIDEFEQHLHPKMQRFLVEKLTTLFPKVQFIVSTHSPIPLLGAPKESVILHVERTKEKGITVQQLTEIDFSNLLPEALLSLVFDFDDFIPRKYDKMNPFETESDANEIIFDKMLKDKVQKLADKNGKKLADFFTKK